MRTCSEYTCVARQSWIKIDREWHARSVKYVSVMYETGVSCVRVCLRFDISSIMSRSSKYKKNLHLHVLYVRVRSVSQVEFLWEIVYAEYCSTCHIQYMVYKEKVLKPR